MLQQDFDIVSWFAGYLAGNLTLEQQKHWKNGCCFCRSSSFVRKSVVMKISVD